MKRELVMPNFHNRQITDYSICEYLQIGMLVSTDRNVYVCTEIELQVDTNTIFYILEYVRKNK